MSRRVETSSFFASGVVSSCFFQVDHTREPKTTRGPLEGPVVGCAVSVFDRRRLPPSVFKLDVDRMRQGWYSDKYFMNIARTLAELARAGYRFGGSAPDLSDLDLD